MIESRSIRDGLDYVKIDEEIYVECITNSFLAYGFNDTFLSAKMFLRYHESVEKHILNIPEEFLVEYLSSHTHPSPELLRYDADFLLWYLYAKCSRFVDGIRYIKVGDTSFLASYIDDFLNKKNFAFLDLLPTLHIFSKSVKFAEEEIVYWIFSHIFRRQYVRIHNFFCVYEKLNKKIQEREFMFAYTFWSYLMKSEFREELDLFCDFIYEYNVGFGMSNRWGSEFDDIVDIYSLPFFGTKNSIPDFDQYEYLIDLVRVVVDIATDDSFSIKELKEKRCSVYVGMMRHMISTEGDGFPHKLSMGYSIKKRKRPLDILATMLSNINYIKNLSVFYELGCENIDVFTLDEISEAVEIATKKIKRSSLSEEWAFLKKLIQEKKRIDFKP